MIVVIILSGGGFMNKIKAWVILNLVLLVLNTIVFFTCIGLYYGLYINPQHLDTQKVLACVSIVIICLLAPFNIRMIRGI